MITIELIGTSPDSWEKAATSAVERASQSLHDLRVAEVAELDLVIESGEVTAYRVKLKGHFAELDAHNCACTTLGIREATRRFV